jgi:DNA replication licensing factor MCM3
VLLERDLVDRVKPGDRVRCVGVYRPLAAAAARGSGGDTSSLFRSVLIGNNVAVLGKEIGAVRLTAADVKNIRCVKK